MDDPRSLSRKRRPRMRARLIVTLACLLGGPLLAEGVLRFLILHPSALARSWGAELRDAKRYGDPGLDDAYWRLDWYFRGEREKERHAHFDPLLGWRGRRIGKGDYRHEDAVEGDPRRPILLYGASYANCVTSREECFEGLVEQSDLATDHVLLNYGVGGYGIDQVYLLMRESLDLYQDRDPIVIIAAVVDSDYERAFLTFRGQAKPRMRVEQGVLVEPEPVPQGTDAYFREHGLGITSYAWHTLVHNTNLLPADWRETLKDTRGKRAEQLELIRAILLAIHAELESRGLQHFFVHCFSPRSFPRSRIQEVVDEIVRTCEEHAIPYVNTRPLYLESCRRNGRMAKHLYVREGQGTNHPTAQGNQLIFRAMRAGIEGHLSNGRPDATVEWTEAGSSR